jgi:hypothetical protein
MRRKAFLGAFGVLCFALGGVVVHAATGTPEIDRANATLQLAGTLKSAGCVGEDSTAYVTYTGSWKGGETQALPDATDYPLTGSMVVSSIKWTINVKTQRGVLTGTVRLTTPASAALVYSGNLTLVTQGMLAAGSNVPGRGWISAGIKLPDEGTTAGDDSLIANVEFEINVGGANAQFGDVPGSLNIPDFSAVTNVAPKALDGVC